MSELNFTLINFADYLNYSLSMALMERKINSIIARPQGDYFEDFSMWCLEYLPVYTAGSGYDFSGDLLKNLEAPVVATQRGGKLTFHGPGQLVVYVFCNITGVNRLVAIPRDINNFIYNLEELIIKILGQFGLVGQRVLGLTGIYVKDSGVLKKIASLGLRFRHWVSYYGFAINYHCNLDYFKAIKACGGHFAVTSMADILKYPIKKIDVIKALQKIIT